jgi:hypothetical protein
MSISVTVSGQSSTSVSSAEALSNTITISGSGATTEITRASENSASITVSTGDPITITGNFSNFVTGDVVRPSEISSFITSSNLSALETATGNLDIRITSNDSDINALQTATGLLDTDVNTLSGLITSNDSDISALNSATGVLSNTTGLLVSKTATGSFLTSGQIDTNINIAVADLVDSAPSTLNTLNELAAALGDNENFSTTTASSLGNLSTATGNLDTRITSNDSDISALQTATGLLDTDVNTISGLITSNDSDITNLNTATGNLDTRVTSNDGDITSLQTATGLIDTDINTVSGLITSNDGDISSLQAVTGLFATTGSDTTFSSVGIGTTEAQEKLHVDEGFILASGASTSHGFELRTDSLDTFQIRHLDGNFTIRNSSDARSDLSIDGSGNVGIGRTNPTKLLDIKDGDFRISSTEPKIFLNDTNNNSDYSIKNNNGSFQISDTTNGPTRLAIDSAGNVGIGTTDAAEKLHVSGNTILSGETIVTSGLSVSGRLSIGHEIPQHALHIVGNSNTLSSDGTLRSTIQRDDNGQTSYDLINSAGRFRQLLNSAGQYRIFDSDNAETRLIINQNGNVCIGAINPSTKLRVDGDITVTGDILPLNDVTSDIGSPSKRFKDLYLSGDSIFLGDTKLFVSGDEIQIQKNNIVRKIPLRDSLNRASNLFVTGNVGIGTNSPQAKLHVSGDTILSGGLTVNGDVKFGIGTAIGPLHLFDTGSTDTTIARFENTSSTSADHDANVQIISRGGGESTIHFINKDNTHTGGFQIGHGDAFSEALFFHNKHDNRTDMVINQAGNVGIGTESPIANLQVGDASSAQTFLMLGPNSNTSSSQLLFGDNASLADPFEAGMGIRYDSLNNRMYFDDNYNNGGSANNTIMTIDRDEQRVGIGTTSPSEALDVNGNILSNGVIKAFNATQGVAQLEVGRGGNEYLEMKVTDPDVFIVAHQDSDSNGNHHFVLDRDFDGTGASDFEIRNSGVAQVTVDKDGNVGIGITSPSAELHIQGNASDETFFRFDTVDNRPMTITAPTTGATNKPFVFGTSNSFQFRIDNDDSKSIHLDHLGNVGLGTVSPHTEIPFLEKAFVVKAGDSSSTTLQQAGIVIAGSSDSDDADDFGSISFINNHSSLTYDRVANIVVQKNGTDVNTSDILFSTADGSALNEVMRLKHNGKVGIGTFSPQAPLDVADDSNIQLRLRSTTSSNNSRMTFSPNSVDTWNIGVNISNDDFTFFDALNSTTPVKFEDGAGDNTLVVDSNSRVGIGTESPQAKLHVSGDTILSGDLTVTGDSVLGKVTLSENSFVTETGNFTLGLNHRGATVLLQNTDAITVTVPVLAPGHVTSFISETSDNVFFVTGAGMSGLNSFGGANSIAGIYGQAQVIYKTSGLAFLGGNIV